MAADYLCVERLALIPGFLPGASASSHVLSLAVQEVDDAGIAHAIAGRVRSVLPYPTDSGAAFPWQRHAGPVVRCFVAGLHQLLHQAGKPRFPLDRVWLRRGSEGLLILGAELPADCARALHTAADTVALLINGSDGDEAAGLCERAVKTLRQLPPGGINPKLILEYALEQRVPVVDATAGFYQLGVGSQSRCFNSTITDQTAYRGVALAKNKLAAAKLLRQAGLPVPRQVRVSSLDEALAAARTIGYPVVLKPAAMDKGDGVIAGIPDEQLLNVAYENVSQLDSVLVVEEFIDGLDLRITVIDSEVQPIDVRVAASVTGDGRATVAELIAAHGERVRRGELLETGFPVHPIEIDWELHGWLSQQGMTLQTIPDAGERVRLKGAANSSKGGLAYRPSRVHPELLQLALRAARVLGLDAAGIDILVPDPAVSWAEQKVAICEINAQPQLGITCMPDLFQRLLPSAGRLPVVVALGHPDDHPWYPCLMDLYQRRQRVRTLGIVTPEGVWLGSERLTCRSEGLYRDGLTLAMDPQLGAMLLFIHEPSVLQSGMPVPCMDAVVLPAGVPENDAAPWQAHWLAAYRPVIPQALILEEAMPWPESGAPCKSFASAMELAHQLLSLLQAPLPARPVQSP